MRIAVDVMGGDHGCGVIIAGVKMALESTPQIAELHLVGQPAEIQAALAHHRCHDPRIRIIHASEVLTMEDKPVSGLRKKKDCSLLRAVELVKNGQAEAIISTGNTGGLLAAATIRLRQLDGIERPAIATVIPSREREFVLLDAGANSECKPIHLLQFAIMGSVYSREILGRKRPRVGVLCNGREEHKGTELTQEAARLCAAADLNFIGYVEGHDLFDDQVEVVVTDGFTGNIVLKTCESMAKGIVHMLKRELMANPLRQAGALLAKAALRNVKNRMDPDAYGGAPLLGLNGNVIKAHGSARELAIKNALRVAAESIQHHINDIICREIAQAGEHLSGPGGGDTATIQA